ncbi:MAG: tRNA lysidine(34) synthetase TilS [Hyphomonadaceae bacterium]
MLDRLTIERMRAEAGEGPILIALSGGGDSVALLHLLAEALGAPRLRAAVVDHALREGSAADADSALGFAEAIGVEGRKLTLSWPDGPKRAQHYARIARYGALCEEARRIGAKLIATGHTRDDQAETVLLRSARGSGWRGLAGVRALAPAPVWPEGRDIRLARPLLRTRRAELRETLSTAGVGWIEDPANTNTDFARVRARVQLAEMEAAGLDPMRFAALAERLRPHVDELDRAALALIDRSAAFEDDLIILDLGAWRAGAAIQHRALSVLLLSAGGGEAEPPADQVDALLPQLEGGAFQGATLAGAWLKPERRGLVIRRDPGALSGRSDGARPLAPLGLNPGEEAIWDRRAALTSEESGWSITANTGAPTLSRGEARRPLAAVPVRWLIRARVTHLLAT